MRKDWSIGREYEYRGLYIYRVTRNDYCVFSENGIVIDSRTLKGAKAEIDRMLEM